jgi:hypothetical protein
MVTKLEFLRSTNNNSWGVGFSEDGILFGSTANGNPSVYLPIPNRYYEQVRGWSSRVLGGIAGNAPMHPITDKVRQVDFHGRFTAAAGHALYTARTYPKEYWNRVAFVCEPTGHLVASFVIDKQGADFKSRNAWNLLASDDEWTSPTMAEVGPDGNVWVIDWYNYIVQHNPTPAGFKTGKGAAYETELRDKKHGRIYRLVMKNDARSGRAGGVSPLIENPVGDKGGNQGANAPRSPSPEKLVAALKHDNLLWRRHAQRLLVEQAPLIWGAAVVPVINLAKDQTIDEFGHNAGVLHALWTLHGWGWLDGSNVPATHVATQALQHKSAAVRRAAAMVLPRSEARGAALVPLLKDSDDQVRLAALLALAETPANPQAGEAVVAALRNRENLSDPWLRDALTAAAARNDLSFLQAMLAEQGALMSGAQEIVAIVAEHYARSGPSATVGTLLNAVPEKVKAGTAADALSLTVLSGLAKGWPRG